MHRTFSYSLLITWLLFTVSCKTNFTLADYNSENISVSEDINPIDSQLVQMYQPYKQILDKEMSRVISVSKIEMVKNKPESELTNFLADLLLEESLMKVQNQNMKIQPQISYFNYGGIRTYLPKGEITVGNIFELMPFENEMVFVELTGKQVQEFLDLLAKKGGDSLGGVRFVISNEKAKDVKINGNKLDPESTYWIVTNDYIVNGGDGMELFTQNLNFINSGEKIRDVIISHLVKKQKENVMLTAELDGRITNE